MVERKDREERLAAALRENLGRRKAQQRERTQERGTGGGEERASPPDDGASGADGEG